MLDILLIINNPKAVPRITSHKSSLSRREIWFQYQSITIVKHVNPAIILLKKLRQLHPEDPFEDLPEKRNSKH